MFLCSKETMSTGSQLEGEKKKEKKEHKKEERKKEEHSLV